MTNAITRADLLDLWQRWIDKSDEIRGRCEDLNFAAPFVSVAPPGYNPDSTPSVLYIGKATRDHWGDTKVSTGSLLDRRTWTPVSLELYATNWLKQYIWNRGWPTPGAFWYFAHSLSIITSNKEIQELQNLVWTNIDKIGVEGGGNPQGSSLRLQCELSVETIVFEIQQYRPKLLFWATGDYAEDVVDRVANDPDRRTWQTDLWDIARCWWRGPIDGMPAMIWAYHPQGKRRDVLDLWLRKARELTAE